jgi:site-specific DNA-methyltransferase (adenine-specific)
MINLMQGDCLEKMKDIESGSVDMILTDPPYGTTACKWDSVIDLDLMWAQLKRVIKPNGAIVMTAAQPFTTILIASNIKQFKYCWVWEKSKATGHLNVKKRPMVKHEDIVVFYKNQPSYNPQGLIKKDIPTISKGNRGKKGTGSSGDCYGMAERDAIQTHTNYPLSITKHNVDMKAEFHPTQKPVALMEYLIKTYTNEGETVLDFTMGSGTTGVAAKNLNRNFIGIEMDEAYFNIAKDRISQS